MAENGNLRKLSPKEEEIMACLWQHGPLFVREIIELLPDPKQHFNTVSTFVRVLENKGWLTHEKIGNSYRYSPTVAGKDYRDKSIKGFVERFFGKSYFNFISTLVKEEKISAKEMKELKEIIEKMESHSEK